MKMTSMALASVFVFGSILPAFSTERDSNQVINELQSILSAPGALVMPSIALENSANEMTAKVRVVTIPRDKAGDLDPSSLSKLEIDKAATYMAEMEDREIRSLDDLLLLGENSIKLTSGNAYSLKICSYLSQKAVKNELRQKVSELLKELHASYLIFDVYNTGSEVVGKQLILVMPWELGRATNNEIKGLVIEIEYVHS